ncbi:MAG: hypothetical protein JW883_02650 [Deltaproteobacteria bacterium]|nr:hypothetical protein [Deltaproteobacteria bacterium]
MATKEFTKIISPIGEDRLRIRIETQKGKVVNVMAQYEAKLGGKWHEIVRYDCGHGFFHRDVM